MIGGHGAFGGVCRMLGAMSTMSVPYVSVGAARLAHMLHRLHQAAPLGEFFRRGREHLVDDLHMGQMNKAHAIVIKPLQFRRRRNTSLLGTGLSLSHLSDLLGPPHNVVTAFLLGITSDRDRICCHLRCWEAP